MARRKKEAPVEEPVVKEEAKETPLAAPAAVPPLKETHDAVAAVVAKDIPQRKRTLTPHVDAVEQMGLGMLRMSLAALLFLPLALFGEVVVFAVGSGQSDQPYAVPEGDPVEVERVDLYAPDAGNGTRVAVSLARRMTLPYRSSVVREEFRSDIRGGLPYASSEGDAPACLWVTKRYEVGSYATSWIVATNAVEWSEFSYTGRVSAAEGGSFAYRDVLVVETNWVNDVLVPYWPVGYEGYYAGADTWIPLSPEWTDSWSSEGSTVSGKYIYYSMPSNALAYHPSVGSPTNWTYLGTPGAASPFCSYVDETLMPAGGGLDGARMFKFVPSWRDGPFEWSVTGATVQTGLRFLAAGGSIRALRNGVEIPVETHEWSPGNVMACILPGVAPEATSTPCRYDGTYVSLHRPWSDASLEVMSRGMEVSGSGGPFRIHRVSGPHRYANVAVWSTKPAAMTEVLASLSVTNGFATAKVPSGVFLVKGDTLSVSNLSSVTSPHRAVVTGRR